MLKLKQKQQEILQWDLGTFLFGSLLCYLTLLVR